LHGTREHHDAVEGEALIDMSVCLCGVDVAVTPDDRLAVSTSFGTLRVWDLGTGQVVRTLEGHHDRVYHVAVTPDGRLVVSASLDNTLKVWDLETGRCLTTLEARAPLWCCATTPNGKTLLAGDEAGALHLLDWRPGRA
jgi:WD40 repeat protein